MIAVDKLLKELHGLRVGAILNPTSVAPDLRHMADVLAGVPGVHLVHLFGPEHGVRGDAQYLEEVPDARDAKTGVPVHSLYGRDFQSLTPRDEHLRGLDALVFDIQDVGSRYYTFVWTMVLAMRFDNLKEGAPAKIVAQRSAPTASNPASAAPHS